MKKIISLLLCIIMLISLCACSLGKDDNQNDSTENTTINSDDIAVSSENFSFTMAEASYVFLEYYRDFRYSYPDSVDMYNIDTSASLKGQIYYDDYSWFDYFSEKTVDYLKELLVYCEAAKACGMELDEDELEQISETVSSWTKYAEDYDYGIENLMLLYFNSDVSIDTIETYLHKEMLARKYQEQYVGEIDYSDEELSSYVEEHKAEFYNIDYLSYTFEETETLDAEKRAEELSKISDPEQFREYVENYLSEIAEKNNMDSKNQLVEKKFKKNDGGKFATYAFGEEAKVGGTYIDAKKIDGIYTVYMLTSLPYLEEDTTRNMLYIEAKISTNSTVEKTKNVLNNILEKYNLDPTADNFAALAEANSEDNTTNLYGGNVSGLMRSSASTYSQELIDWLYDDGRAEGDTGIVKGGNEDYYAVYYLGEGEISWKYSASIAKLSEDVESKYNELSEIYAVTVNNDVIAGING